MDLSRHRHPLQTMPRQPPLGWERQSLAEETFLEIHLRPKAWAEAESEFHKLMAARLHYDMESEGWARTRRIMVATYSNLHRQAERGEWIEKVGEAWRLAGMGLARLRNEPMRPSPTGTSDAHDSELKQFLREFLQALEPEGYVLELDEWHHTGIPDLDERIETRPLFRDMGFHTRAMNLGENANPQVLCGKVKRLAQIGVGKRREIRKECEDLLRKAHPAWSKKSRRPLTAPLAALETVLEEMASRRPEAFKRLAAPVVEGNEVRVGNFTLFVGNASDELPRIRHAWSNVIKVAKQRLLGAYRGYRRARKELQAAKAKCRTSIEELLVYPHYPGICKYRRFAQRSASNRDSVRAAAHSPQ